MTFSKRWLKGETREIEIYCVDDDDESEDLSVASGIELEIKVNRGDPDPALVRKTIGSGVTLLDQTEAATKGRARILVDAADTASLDAGAYWLDVVVLMPGSPARRNYAIQPTRIVLEDVVNGA